MAKIIVCWNDNAFAKQLKEKQGEDIFVCTCWRELMTQKIKKADLFVVLCELEWDHTVSEAPFNDFRGVSLVQQYLRSEKGVTAPVLFVSILSPEKIVEFKEDTDIVMTPALQHGFLQLPSGNPKEFLVSLYDYLPTIGSMKKMGDKDLAYTRMFYCDLNGMLRRIHHLIRDFNANNETVEDYRKKYKNQIKQLRHIIEHHFPTDKNTLTEELAERNDLHTFCQKLLDQWDSNQTIVYVGNTERQKPVTILYLEDNVGDDNVERFKQFCTNHARQFKLDIVSDSNSMPEVLDLSRSVNHFFANYDVVICDIELRDQDGLLQYLGYDMIEKMAKKTRKPLYYIVTNMSRSVYDQVKPDIVKRIMLKSEAFGSDANIEKFLYGIQEVLKDREGKQKGANDIQNIFNYFYCYIESNKGFPICFSFTNLKKEGQPDNIEHVELSDFNELNDFVNSKATELYGYFIKLIDENKNGDNPCDFLTFNKCCKDFRTQIGETMQRGGRNFRSTLDVTMNPLQDDLVRFVKILILRRLFLCIERFVIANDISNKFKNYREQLPYKRHTQTAHTEKLRSFSLHDIAFRAIGEQFKSLNIDSYLGKLDDSLFGSDGTEVTKTTKGKDSNHFRAQSRLDATLLWANSKDLALTKEEADFQKNIESSVVNH